MARTDRLILNVYSMASKRPASVSDLGTLEPPFFRGSPRHHLDSAQADDAEQLHIAGYAVFSGKLRTVTALLATPHCKLLAAANDGTARFAYETQPDFLTLRFGISGRFRYETGRDIIADEPDVLVSGGSRIRVQASEPAILLVALDERQVAHALGTGSCPAVGTRSLKSVGGPNLREMAFRAATDAENLGPNLRPLFLRNYQNAMACALAALLRQMRPERRAPDPMIGRRKVADLREWAAQDHDDPVTIGDLAARCGLGLRALQKNFLRHFDTTPAEYLRGLRLAKARKLILSGAFTVTHAALEAGFVHLGHFSANYEKRFGELPRETLLHAPPASTQE